MARLIDANAIPYEVRYVQSRSVWGFEHGEFVEKSAIEQMPTVDAVEVVHGRWKKLPYHPYRCSICDEIAPLDQSGEFHYTSNYCPNCGADMRERKDND